MSENKEMEAQEMNEERELMYLTDEEGNEFPFELLDVIDYNDEQYAVFFPAEESEIEDDGEVVILKVTPHEDGSADFESTDNETVLDAVFDIFMKNLQEAFSISDEEIAALGGEHHCDCGDEHCCH